MKRIRRRKAHWQATVNGQDWLFWFDPEAGKVVVKRKRHHRIAGVLSLPELLDAATGKLSLPFAPEERPVVHV